MVKFKCLVCNELVLTGTPSFVSVPGDPPGGMIGFLRLHPECARKVAHPDFDLAAVTEEHKRQVGAVRARRAAQQATLLAVVEALASPEWSASLGRHRGTLAYAEV